MKTISAFIAALGENPAFVAFNAHCWFAFSVVYVLASHGVPELPLAAIVCLVAVVKEFWFDARYEQNPPQTFWDNLDDAAGYAVGMWFALAMLKWWPA
jgi:hypothetical protein